MSKKKTETKPRRVQIIFEVEEGHTGCCECAFGHVCPYACAFGNKLDCAIYNLGTLELKSINPIEEQPLNITTNERTRKESH